MLRRMIISAFALTLSLVACSSANDSTSKGASSTPTAPAETLLAFVTRADATPTAYTGQPDTVEIVTLDGTVKAKATYTPHPVPFAAEFDTLLAPDAVVADGSVFYADGAGLVRRLNPDGSIKDITAFPFSSPQAQLSFAVSPDGKKLAAIVLQLPDKNPKYKQPGDAPFVKGQRGRLTVYRADAGSSATVARSAPIAAEGLDSADRIVGWDDKGPIVAPDGVLFTSDAEGSEQMYRASKIVRLADNGTYGAPVGGPGCRPWTLSATAVVCIPQPSEPVAVSVRTHAGAKLFSFSGDFASFNLRPFLSPDGSIVAAKSTLWSKSGKVALDPTFCAGGWIDNTTVMGFKCEGETPVIETIEAKAGAKATPLGSLGLETFIGVVTHAA